MSDIWRKSEYFKTVNHWVKELEEYKPINDQERYSHKRILEHYRRTLKNVRNKLYKMLKELESEKTEYWCSIKHKWDNVKNNVCFRCEYKGKEDCIDKKKTDLINILKAPYFEEEEEDE